MVTKRLRSFSEPEEVKEFFIVDQDRDEFSSSKIQALSEKISVLTFPFNLEQIAALGHDHAAALNHCLKIKYSTEYIIIFDSDCFPTDQCWIKNINQIFMQGYDAIVARDPSKYGLSHPCFLVIPVSALSGLDFADGLLEVRIDTGRLIGYQLAKMGYRVFWSDAVRVSSQRGHFFYLDGSIYHHGSASFVSSKHSILSSQINASVEEFFKKKVARGQYRSNFFENLYLRLLRFSKKIFNRY